MTRYEIHGHQFMNRQRQVRLTLEDLERENLHNSFSSEKTSLNRLHPIVFANAPPFPDVRKPRENRVACKNYQKLINIYWTSGLKAFP